MCFFIISAVGAQTIKAPYALTIEGLKQWTLGGPTADTLLIADVPLEKRFINIQTQLNTDLSNAMKIAYLPDGMNNLASYGEEQATFNLYNFTHWSYIDTLVWFGGTADQTVQLPSAPWVNTAHKNGVTVLGNIFFAPRAFGGTNEQLTKFLEKDAEGNFIVVPIMIEIMQFYNFDGWFINEETSTDSNIALLMKEFMRDLTSQVEKLGKQVMWYDAMLPSGYVGWQNKLNSSNSVFLQDNLLSDGTSIYDVRVSSSIFINFSWPDSAWPNASKERARQIGRSEFDIFTGVDLWPGRNQGRFQTEGNSWMAALQNGTNSITSLGLFAPNCVFNNSEYTSFQDNPRDYKSFYSEERHMFAGADRNPRIEDATGFKGFANWVPASSTITELPFETNFNTGHGLGKWKGGKQVSKDAWHAINAQDILPTWQFAFSEDKVLEGSWDFQTVYNGGNSMRIEGSLNANEPIDLLLYKTCLPITEKTKIDVTHNRDAISNAQMMVLVDFEDPSIETAQFILKPIKQDSWGCTTLDLGSYAGNKIATLGLQFFSEDTITDFGVNIGNLKVYEP